MLKSIYMKAARTVSKNHKPGSSSEVLYLMSFPENNVHLLNQLSEYYGNRFIVCYKKNAFHEAKRLEKAGVRILPMDDSKTVFYEIIPHLTKSKLIFVDNYFPIIGAVDFHPDTKVIQLWHAVGAMKAFGWSSKRTQHDRKKDKERYQSVYKKHTHFVVASKKMENVFREAWLATSNKMLHFGNPRCDIYFDKEFLKNAREEYAFHFPESKTKKVFMYAPTFREEGLKRAPMGFKQMNALLQQLDALLYVRLHPKESDLLKELGNYSNIITHIPGLSLEQILPNIDVLISDYSSVPFEYTLANPKGKCIFYVPDYIDYKEKIGLVDGYKDFLPGEMVQTQGALMQLMKEMLLPQNESEEKESIGKKKELKKKPLTFQEFNQVWNTKNNGMATMRLMDYLRTL
ncbi:MAG: CDP-glycerol glycerophosphotransferase family protein [Streptococcaceae bacterium]|jgi:CDP-glycerol glycerophosphotransferase (TagB/SpsB family)|nr:CDP-glycerol glycerophosphotransferase family protein [Streptococcaceae bacterium]